MKVKVNIILLFLIVTNSSFFAQEANEKQKRVRFDWAANANILLDNQEFSGTTLRTSQTLLGIRLAPEVGIGFDSIHHLRAGVDVLAGLGGKKFVDDIALIAYYHLDYAPFRCYVGLFPRRFALPQYPQVMIQDSINFYRPNMAGVFLEFYKPWGYVNAWLDWVSLPTKTERELFFIGASARYKRSVFVADLYGYMYHKAHRKGVPHTEPLHDNGMTLLSAGIDFTEKTPLDTLSFTVGWLQAYERSRAEKKWHFPVGVTADLNIRYSGFGIKNMFYYGKPQQIYYEQLGNILYWGDHAYAGKLYNRTDIYLDFMNSPFVNARLTYSLHCMQGKVYSEQLFTVYVNIDQDYKKKPAKPQFFWSKWIREGSRKKEKTSLK